MNPASPAFTDEQFELWTHFAQGSDEPKANRQRARLLGLTAKRVRVAPGAIVRLKAGASIGEACFIGLYSYVNGEVTLEDHVLIGPHCSITSNTHLFRVESQAFTGGEHRAIRIGRGTWLCAGVTVTAGVTIGRANLICANSVVARDTLDHAIMAGTPARQVGHIDPHDGSYHWST